MLPHYGSHTREHGAQLGPFVPAGGSPPPLTLTAPKSVRPEVGFERERV